MIMVYKNYDKPGEADAVKKMVQDATRRSKLNDDYTKVPSNVANSVIQAVNTASDLKCISNHLIFKDYNIVFLEVAAFEAGVTTEMPHLSLNKWSFFADKITTFQQSISGSFENPNSVTKLI